MIVLLVIADRALRSLLASVCMAALPGVRCIESANDVDSLMLDGSERIDIVVLEPSSPQDRRMARVANWRRMVPRAHVMVLGSDPEKNESMLREAIARLHARG